MDPTYPYPHRFVVVDDFYVDPDSVRARALSAHYRKPADSAVWRSVEKPFVPGIRTRLEQCWGAPIMRGHWKNAYNGPFCMSNARGPRGSRPFVHVDRPFDYVTVLVYLTPDLPSDCGTTFYWHKPTGLIGAPDSPTLRDMGLSADTFEDWVWSFEGHRNVWEVVDRVAYRYNRALLFPAGFFHSASRHIGSTLIDCRLWQSFHFKAKF